MANKTINDLTAATSAATDDFVPIWRASNGDTRKITKANFIGATFTGAGTLATGGFTLTVAGTSTINGSLVGNMTGGGTLATGGFTLTLSSSGTLALGGFTLTVPATGTASLLGTAQTYSALKTFSAGIAFANETLSTYDTGTWSPTIQSSAGAPTVTYTIQNGRYTRIGDLCFFAFFIRINTYSVATASGETWVSLPFTASSTNANSHAFSVTSSNIDWPGTPIDIAGEVLAGTNVMRFFSHQDNTTRSHLPPANLAAADDIACTGFYWV